MWNPDKYWEQLIFALAALICGFIVSRILRVIVGRFFKRAALKLNVDPTHYSFFKNAVDMIIFLVTLIVVFRSIPALRTFGTTLLTGAGILAAIVGAALACSGAVFQAILRNPLAEPYILGVSSGASFGAALALLRFPIRRGIGKGFIGSFVEIGRAHV